MRAGWIVSAIGHVGFVMMTFLAWESRSALPEDTGSVVPVEIVDVAPESNVRALAMDVPDEEVSPEMNPEEPEEEVAPSPDPQPPQPNRRRPRFDPSQLAGMFDKENDPGPERTQGDRSDRNQRSAGLGTAQVAAIEDRAAALVRAHMRRYWRMPADLPDPERYIVVVEFDLNRNGTLNGQPRVTSPTNYTFDPYMRRAVQEAVRAVRAGDPYPFPDDPIVGEHYELWRNQVYTFRVGNNQ
jgi:outer membrane biosynthesis protein TonB